MTISVLVTGGCGFIGSHTCLELIKAGYKLIVLDNFANGSPESLRRVQELAGQTAQEEITLLEGDIRNLSDLNNAFQHGVDAVIHFAGLKSVGESTTDPLLYWEHNVNGSIQLFSAMRAHGCKTIVFSSSATLYGATPQVPIPETAAIYPINPYGQTKATVERILADLCASEQGWRIACLRYFNPVGAHPSGKIGENPTGTPSNLLPLVSQVAARKRDRLCVFGSDWPTYDGTGVRDYIHVMDLAEGHRDALSFLRSEEPQLLTLNLGTGRGYSVIDVITEFERISGRKIPYVITDRRVGDAAISVADVTKAKQKLSWNPKRSLVDMCRDCWRWQQMNPRGYA